jgi:hypothetical protein
LQQASALPEEIENEHRTSLGFKAGNQIGNMGIYGEKEDKRKMKFPKDVGRI